MVAPNIKRRRALARAQAAAAAATVVEEVKETVEQAVPVIVKKEVKASTTKKILASEAAKPKTVANSTVSKRDRDNTASTKKK